LVTGVGAFTGVARFFVSRDLERLREFDELFDVDRLRITLGLLGLSSDMTSSTSALRSFLMYSDTETVGRFSHEAISSVVMFKTFGVCFLNLGTEGFLYSGAVVLAETVTTGARCFLGTL